MKNTNKLTAVLLALTALALTACPSDGGNGNGTGTAPTITTASLPGGTVETAYSQTLTATGDAPITWSLESGTLPNGLTLSTDGVISGNPAMAGTFNFTVKATNATGNDTEPLSITIALIAMVSVPGGSFQMGNPDTSIVHSNERPVHTVTLTGFSIGKYEVTQAQYEAVMGSNPSNFTSNPASGEVQANRPVEQVSWYDAIEFCNALSAADLSAAVRAAQKWRTQCVFGIMRHGRDADFLPAHPPHYAAFHCRTGFKYRLKISSVDITCIFSVMACEMIILSNGSLWIYSSL